MPNWINENVPYKDFVAAKKNKSGTLIEVLYKNRRHQYLIGDINTSSSFADGEKSFDEDAIITRYKVIFSF